MTETVRTDPIQRITADYRRITKRMPTAYDRDPSAEYIIEERSEHLILDRETKTAKLILLTEQGFRVTHRVEAGDFIGYMLDEIGGLIDAAGISDDSDTIRPSHEKKEYTLTVEYKEGAPLTLSGCFDLNGLPAGFPDFAKEAAHLLNFGGCGELLDPKMYLHARRRSSELIFCSVSFERGYKEYYYLTEDDSLDIGDLVLVPAGELNTDNVVKIRDVEYFEKDDVPMPLEKVKYIIGKCTSPNLEQAIPTAIYNNLKNRFHLRLTEWEADEDSYSDRPVLTAQSGGLLLSLYVLDELIVLDITDRAKTKGTHWYPLNASEAIEDITAFMEGHHSYELYPLSPDSKEPF